MKKCFKCGEIKALTEFYKHPEMKDGRVNKCKDCNKKDVSMNRKKHIEYYREYDKDRGNRQTYEYVKEYREKNPFKFRAHQIVRRAIRAKKLFAEPCEQCGRTEDIHAHHDDYLKPLNVRWLCPVCHKAWHMQNGEGLNGSF